MRQPYIEFSEDASRRLVVEKAQPFGPGSKADWSSCC